MLPQNGRRSGVDLSTHNMAYHVLVQSIKQELASALEKVAEESAKRILVELHKGGSFRSNAQSKDEMNNTHKDNLNQFTPTEHTAAAAIPLPAQDKVSSKFSRMADTGENLADNFF